MPRQFNTSLLCSYGGIGRRGRFRFCWATPVQVQVLLAALFFCSFSGFCFSACPAQSMEAAQDLYNTDSGQDPAGIDQDIPELTGASGYESLMDLVTDRVQDADQKGQDKACPGGQKTCCRRAGMQMYRILLSRQKPCCRRQCQQHTENSILCKMRAFSDREREGFLNLQLLFRRQILKALHKGLAEKSAD